MDSFNNYIIDSKQLVTNVVNIKNVLNTKTMLCAVVKADAYGLGLERVCSIIAPYVDYFAVACVKEAKALRMFNKQTPVVILSIIPKDCYNWCVDNNVSVTVSSEEDLIYIENNIDKKIKVHIPINTGLNRIGISKTKQLKKMLDIIESGSHIELEGIFSHFATKQNDVVFIKKQFYNYCNVKRVIKNNVMCHIANSFATIYNKLYQLDMVRCGYLIYGNMSANGIYNKPVLKIVSAIASLTNVKKGESVGYDRTYIAKDDMLVAVIPIGYADGLDRRLSNKGYFYIKGKKCPIVGNVCMDAAMVDVTNIEAKIGDNVLILGCDGANNISLDDYARILGTSPYEVQIKFRYDRMNYIVV